MANGQKEGKGKVDCGEIGGMGEGGFEKEIIRREIRFNDFDE